MRKVRQDGGIRYHVNLLQAMVSIHKRLSAGNMWPVYQARENL